MSFESSCRENGSALLLYWYLFTTRRSTLIGVLLILAGGEGWGCHDLFSDGSLQEQAAWAGAAEM
jgi:hypothetical protein